VLRDPGYVNPQTNSVVDSGRSAHRKPCNASRTNSRAVSAIR